MGFQHRSNNLTYSATRELLEDILLDEDRHVDEIEELLDQINHMTLPVFLSTQVS